MSTAEAQRSRALGVALRCTRAAVIALVAVLAVLAHHETVAPMTHGGSSHADATAGMDHGSDDAGFCSGMAMQHCSAVGVDTVKPVPPAAPAGGHHPAHLSDATAGRDVPGTVNRAPPDLSLLSRLLL